MKPLRYMILSLGLILLAPLMAMSAPSARIALLPYAINADQDLTFLQNGVFDMMSSRLSSADASVIDRSTINKTIGSVKGAFSPAAARETGQRLGANYVVYGSITKIGNDISLDTKILAVASAAEPETFSETCKNMGEIIPKLNSTATQINNRYFGGGKPATVAVAMAPGPLVSAPTATPSTAGASYDSRMDPNKMIAEGVTADVDAMDTRTRSAVFSGQFWKSQSFKEYLTGIALGDVNKDGQNEVVIASKTGVAVYKFVNKRLQKITTLIEKTKNTIVSIDIADINGNGYPEIFISSLGPNLNVMTSSVVEYDGKAFKTIVSNSPYFYRVAKPVGDMVKRTVLLAQSGTGLEAPYPREFYELAWSNGNYEVVRTMRLSRGENVLGFSMGNFNKDGAELFLGYSTEDKLNMFGADGRFVWKGDEVIGGRHENMNLHETSVNDTENYRYLPMRTLAADLNNDGMPEFITIKNERFSSILSFRSFTSGQVLVLDWDGLSMDTISSSRKLNGLINDFALDDFDNDGELELIVVNVIDTGLVVGTTPRSMVVAYKLNKLSTKKN